MKSFIFGLIFILSLVVHLPAKANPAAFDPSLAGAPGAEATQLVESSEVTCEQTHRAVCTGDSENYILYGGLFSSDGHVVKIVTDGESCIPGTIFNKDGDSKIAAKENLNDPCKEYAHQHVEENNEDAQKFKDFARTSSIIDLEGMKQLTKYTDGLPKIDIDCSNTLLETEGQVVSLKSDLGESKAVELFDAGGDKLLTYKGCVQVFKENFQTHGYEIAQHINTGGEPSLNLCKAYGQVNCEAEYKACIAGECKSLSSCFNKTQVKQELSAMVTTCSALQKAHKSIKNLDTETDGEEDNYVTVDYDGQSNSRGGFTCKKGPGRFALDYRSCKKAAHAFNAGFVFGDVVGEVGVQAYGAIQGANNQAAVGQEATSGEVGAQQSAAIEAGRRQQILQRNQQMARAGIQGAKGATMLAFMNSYVTAKKVKNDWCIGDNGGGGSEDEQRLSGAESCALMYMYIDSEDNEANRRNQIGMRGILFPNGHVTGMLGQNAASSLAQALVAGVLAKLHDKQAKMIGQVKDEFENANFNQPQTGISTEGLPTFCSENPTAPSCRAVANNKGNGGSGFNVDFGNGIGGAPNEIGFNNEDVLSESEKRELANVTREGVDSIPDLTNKTSDGKGNSDLTAIAPGNVNSARRNAGGGAGGGAAGGGAGGGAGPGPEPKTAESNQGPLGKKTGVKYSGGSSGNFTGGGSAKKKTSTNPFDGLTGKSSNRTVASQVEKKILPKDIKLFGAISKRYTEVSRSGRLETTK